MPLSGFYHASETRNGYIQAAIYSSTAIISHFIQSYFLRNSLSAAVDLVRAHVLFCFRPGVHSCFGPPSPASGKHSLNLDHRSSIWDLFPTLWVMRIRGSRYTTPWYALILGGWMWPVPVLLFQPLTLSPLNTPLGTHQLIDRLVYPIPDIPAKLDRMSGGSV